MILTGQDFITVSQSFASVYIDPVFSISSAATKHQAASLKLPPPHTFFLPSAPEMLLKYE